MERLLQYPWYGNVRELENSMEFMINMMGNDGILDSKTLPEAIREYSVKKDEEPMEKKDRMGVICLKELEKREIKKALKLFGEDTEGKKRAAKALGISLATLYRKMEVVSQSEN